uniref:Acyltransferase 3 domain-containing protein n=1 Tax=Glossina austeni TaxID=7395 RepID=A0A1A9VM86_GLOAU
MVQGFLDRGVITKPKSIIITIQFLGSYADQMPELYKLDDYDKCLSRTQSVYCMVYAEVVPDNSSKLWNFIDVYSKDYRYHFRHDHLLFGICVDRCEILLETLSLSEQSELYDERVESSEITEYYAKVYREETEQHSSYQQLLGKCLNYDFRAKFGLQLKTFIEYCEYPDKTLKLNGWALAAYGVFAIFVVVNILSSCYDYYLLRQQTEDSETIGFYKRDFKTSAHKLLTSFSIYRNYYRLTRPLPQEYEQLKFLNGYRFVYVFMVVASHSKFHLALAPIQNIIEVEDIEKSPAATISQGGPVMIQTFFLITAFMLKLKFNDLHLVTPQTKMSKCCKVFAKVFTLRYLRIVPSLIMLILFEAFLLQSFGDGPLWKHVVQPESVLCREYWWKNIFMLNNILMHYSVNGWALAAYGVFAIFVVVNILSSCYDYYLLRQQTEDSENIDFYKRDFKTSAHKLLTSFSIYRNYYRLTRPLPQEYEQLKFLNGYRFACIFITVAAHSIVYLTLSPIQNIVEVEEIKKSPAASISQGGPVIMQTFFLITAFMLKLKFNDLHLVTPQTKMSKCCKVFAKVFTLRYLRIVPSLIMLILFEAFLLQSFGDGPLWKHVVQPESVLCREYWWKNIFMLNNILMHYSCSHHTWYLATDTQLTVFFLIIAIVMSRSYRYLFIKDFPTFYQGYVPFYMNLGAYLGGFILADIYTNYIRCNDKLKKRFTGVLKYEFGYWLVYLVGFLLICSSSYFINYEGERPPFLVAAYAGLFRNVWAFVNVLAFLGNFFKLGCKLN